MSNATTDAQWLAEEVLDAFLHDGLEGADSTPSQVDIVRASKGALDVDRSFHAEEPRVAEEKTWTLTGRVSVSAAQQMPGLALPSEYTRHKAIAWVTTLELEAAALTIRAHTDQLRVDGRLYVIRSVVLLPQGVSRPAVARIEAVRDDSQ